MRMSKFWTCFLSLVLCICMVSIPAYAAPANADINTLSSEQCQAIISKVDANENIYNVDLGNGLSVAFIYNSVVPTRSTASDSYSGYYYLTENKEKVAVFSFSAKFTYNGSSVSYSSSSASASPIKDDWSIQYSRSHDDSQTVISTASCVFTLYQNGSYNNSNTVTISCTKNGTTSVVSN